jgi:pimeloyl-ACP methyl ester carboxylesterase
MTTQPEIAGVTRVCSYDRAGLGWSEDREGSRDGRRLVAELRSLLDAAEVPPPYIMVGHSLGGPLIMVFTKEYPSDVAGLVFVDATDPEGLERRPPELRGDIDAALKPPRLPLLLAETGVLRLLSRSSRSDWPDELVSVAGAFAPQSVRRAFREIQELPETLAQAAATESFADRPVVVLTAGRFPPNPDRSQDEIRQVRELRLQLQEELAALSTNGDHRMVDDAAHFIQLDAPEAVTAAVEDVVAAVRSGGLVGQEEGPDGSTGPRE